MHAIRLLSLLVGFAGAPLLAQTGVRWTPAFDVALATAKAEQKVVLLAFNLAGERANDELVADHYKDGLLGALSLLTVNVFCSPSAEPRVAGVSVAQQQAAEQAARLQVLKIGPGEDVIAPQHVFLGPDGTVLSSVPYRVTKGELEWAWVDAIRRVDPTFSWKLSPGARAPGRLGFGRVERGQNDTPPTAAEVEAALKELRKSRGGLLRNLQSVEVLMRSDAPEAIQFVDTTLKGIQATPLAAALDTIGVISPKAYHAVVTAHLGDRDDDVRYAAAGALERLAEPKALPAALKQLKVEKQDRVRGRLLRACASSAPTHKDVMAQVEKTLAKEPSADVRAHAVLALALVEDKARVLAGLDTALRDRSAKVRATVAYALAARRETEFAHRLGEAASREEDAETKAWLEAAVGVVRGGDGKPFEHFLERVLGEQPVRAGLQGLGLGGGGGGRRGGG
jgi:HEAT repeat protein